MWIKERKRQIFTKRKRSDREAVRCILSTQQFRNERKIKPFSEA
jgi:hypothetical protein